MHFDSVSVGLSLGDPGWASKFDWRRVDGGVSRAQTVLRLLESLGGMAEGEDWVWVHDAVRPFVSSPIVGRLKEAITSGGNCFVVGLPAVDTLKQVGKGQLVEMTLDRERIWFAQTPQVCRLDVLTPALRKGLESGAEITDEASAMELVGEPVKMVVGCEDNLKITRPGDMTLAELIYEGRNRT